LEPPPSGMTIDPLTGLVQWVPTPAQLGIQTVPIVATDPEGNVSVQLYQVQVYPSLQSLTIVSQPVRTITAGRVYRYDVRVDDTAGAQHSFSLVDGPEGMTVDGFGQVTWLPAIGDVGSHPV